MFLALVALNVFHPGRILQGPDAKFQKLSRAEKKEQKRIAKMEKAKQKMDILRSDDEAEEGFPLQSYGSEELHEDGERRYYGH